MGTPVFAVSHSFNGQVSDKYEDDYGIIGLQDMTLEAAYTKLCWLMARTDISLLFNCSTSFIIHFLPHSIDLEQKISLMKLNLRGEMRLQPFMDLAAATPYYISSLSFRVFIFGLLLFIILLLVTFYCSSLSK